GLKPGRTRHLTHLLTVLDPSPHILSPTADPLSPSFVASTRYEFELFALVPDRDDDRADDDDDPDDPDSSSSSNSPPRRPRLAGGGGGGPLADEWPESHERARMVANGWDELVARVCWGRRETVMRDAIDRARAFFLGGTTDSDE
ncbi:hypothetical protein JCM11491_001143, partial [Sporobolomyces phaffii]